MFAGFYTNIKLNYAFPRGTHVLPMSVLGTSDTYQSIPVTPVSINVDTGRYGVLSASSSRQLCGDLSPPIAFGLPLHSKHI